MLPSKIKPLTLLIATAILPVSSYAQINMQQAAEQTFDIITSIQQRANAGDGVIVENGKRYIDYNQHRFELHQNNYPKFPFPYGGTEALIPYYDTFPFLDDKWDIVMNNDYGFYFIHDEFGSMSSSTQGCFIEYWPNQSFSIAETMRFEKTECISAPVISELQLSGIYDVGANITWQGHQPGNQYHIQLTSAAGVRIQDYNASEPEFFIPELVADTEYQIQLQACNTTGCIDVSSISFTTAPTQMGFHDGIRQLNHLQGDFGAHLSLMQSHSLTAPFGNVDIGAPDVVIKRDAMLLVTPQLGDINQLWLEAYQDGVLLGRLPMLSPAQQPKTDQYQVDGRPSVIFGHQVWSLPLPWDWMQPGLTLAFTDNHGRHAELAQPIEFGGAPELVIQNIDMGMLTQPRGRNTMANNTAEHAADYFQKIPVSKMVIGQYAPAYFATVTMPNGKVYTERSDTDGGWHSGDMREAIGKSLISTGINNANVGISATAGSSQAYNRRFNHITAHTNVGVYTDAKTHATKTVVHGGSGGGGIVTLEATTGNEWSHELAHNYGLGHYPSMASVHDMQSGWGWDNLFGRFIGGLDWRGSASETSLGGETVAPYLDTFRFLRDSQAGGEGQKVGMVSNFTYQHPMQVRRVQAWLNSGYNQDPSSASYYVKWDQALQAYIDAETDFPAAVQTGVPVTTLVGIYDPMRVNASLIYPVLYGNYGNTFNLPEGADYTPAAGELSLIQGWHPLDSLTAEQVASTSWKTIVDNGSYKRLCQFSFQTSAAETVNLIGSVDPQTNICQVSDDMRWTIDGQRQVMQSPVGDYSLLYPFGRGEIRYTPTPQIGEVRLCLLTDINNTSHNGAGYVSDDKCVQIAGIKHSNNRDWMYTIWRNNIEQGQYIHHNVCRLEVVDSHGQSSSYDLAGQRLNSSESNKFHINLPQQTLANVSLSCEDGEGVHQLAQLTPSLETGLDSLPNAVIIGQQYGYQALTSNIGNGWFKHTAQMDLNNLSQRDRNNLATMKVGDVQLPICRFDLNINGTMQTVHGFVEQLATGDYRCSGGDDISVRQAGIDERIESPLNQFEWLSLWNPAHTGERIKAKGEGEQLGSNRNLCSLINNGFYGAGFVNAGGQCVQVEHIKWSNGLDWVFSSRFGQYSYK